MKIDCPSCGGWGTVEKCKGTRDTYSCTRCLKPFNKKELGGH